MAFALLNANRHDPSPTLNSDELKPPPLFDSSTLVLEATETSPDEEIPTDICRELLPSKPFVTFSRVQLELV